MAVPIKEVDGAITLNKVLLAKSTSQKPSKYRADSVSNVFGQRGSALEQLEQEETDYCNPAAYGLIIAIVCLG